MLLQCDKGLNHDCDICFSSSSALDLHC